jgi:aminoglycoside 6'-N-acetyltransferase I
MIVRSVTPSDGPAWLRLRHAFWPDGSEAEHADEIAAFFEGRAPEPLAVLIAEDGTQQPLGLVELSIRPCAEGCRTTRVAYLEGWYVVPEARKRGVGRALVVAAEAWARSQGCTEFASDAELANDVSMAAHKAVGFVEVGQIRCFRREL